MRLHKWNYNDRTGLGEITYLDGLEPRYELLSGSAASAYDEREKRSHTSLVEALPEERVGQDTDSFQQAPDGAEDKP